MRVPAAKMMYLHHFLRYSQKEYFCTNSALSARELRCGHPADTAIANGDGMRAGKVDPGSGKRLMDSAARKGGLMPRCAEVLHVRGALRRPVAIYPSPWRGKAS